MIDSTKIDELIVEARRRDGVVCKALLEECARLTVIAPYTEIRQLDLNQLVNQLMPAKVSSSGRTSGSYSSPPDDGSYANQLFSAICFVIDARAELKLLELIASPTFYDAIMRSAAEKKD